MEPIATVRLSDKLDITCSSQAQDAAAINRGNMQDSTSARKLISKRAFSAEI